MAAISRLTAAAVTVGVLLASPGAAFAGLGQPTPWQLGLQDAASPVMADIVGFHNFLLFVITAITVFVLVLLLIIMLRAPIRHPRAPPTIRRSKSSGRSFRSSSW
jgi:cytochrome c oxidase subunit 2